MRVLLATNNFLEPTHHAIAKVVSSLRNADITVAAKRFFRAPAADLPNVSQRVELEDWLGVEAAVDRAEIVHCTVDSEAVLSVAEYAQKAGIPTIFTFMGGYDSSAKMQRPEFLGMVAPLLRHSAAITVVSPTHARMIAAVAAVPIVTLPVPIWDIPEPEDAVADRILGRIGVGPPYVVACGRLILRKGFDNAIRLLHGLPDPVRLIVIGGGALRPFLSDLAAREGVAARVAFTGELGLDETLAVMSRSRALLHLAQEGVEGDLEGVPQVILWAQLLGIPVIATQSGCIPDVVEHMRSGIITELTRGGLAAAYREATGERAADLIECAKRRVSDNHSLAWTVSALERIYAMVIEARSSAPRQSATRGMREAAIDEILDDADPGAAIVSFRHSRRHVIAELNSPRFGHCALKVRAEASSTSGSDVVYPTKEVVVLQSIVRPCSWAPQLFNHDPGHRWLLRSWAAGSTLEAQAADWTKEAICRFTDFARAVFTAFHDNDPAAILKDFKPQNIVYDGKVFTLIDFDSVGTVDDLRHRAANPQVAGSGKFRYVAPEIVLGDRPRIGTAADYFSLGTCVFRLVMGFVPWTNIVASPAEAMRRYEIEFAQMQIAYRAALASLGFRAEAVAFFVDCLHPDAAARPRDFSAVADRSAS